MSKHDLPRPDLVLLPKSSEKVAHSTVKVLLLDDDEDFRKAIRCSLNPPSYHLTEVSNGVEGVREIMQDTFDVIICDMMMPRAGGEMFYWTVCRLQPEAASRFLFITGHQGDSKIEQFLKRGQASVLHKPFAIEALLQAVRQVGSKAHSQAT